MSKLAFFYQLQGQTYQGLQDTDFLTTVVDNVETPLTSSQIGSLNADGKQIWVYTSLGEAATYHEYYSQGGWDTNPPDFLLTPNFEFTGSIRVKFWDPDWQDVQINRILDMQDKGYNGVYMDVVDSYLAPVVQDAFYADFPGSDINDLYNAMTDFVVAISDAVRAVDPDFTIIAQNGTALLDNNPIVDLNQTLSPNMRFIDAIDGLAKESTFVFGELTPPPWGPYDAKYVENVINAGKFVIGLEYPTQGTANYAWTNALADGYIPYLDDRVHDGEYTAFTQNFDTLSQLSPSQLDFLTVDGGSGTTVDNGNFGGTSGNDNIAGTAGDDQIFGLEGDDTLSGANGNDNIYGWDGNDRLFGGYGNDLLFGDAGNDQISAGEGNDYAYGWTGNDTIDGAGGNDVLYADAGRDRVTAGNGDDIVFGADGDDTIDGGNDNDQLYGDVGNDLVSGGSGNDRLYGWTGNDTLNGGSGNDSIAGDGGNDVINAGSGNDWVYASLGDDDITLGNGNDWAFGDVGNDTIRGDGGSDVIFAWEGNDALFGGSGNDLISGEAGDDFIVGGTGNDSLYGGDGLDYFQFVSGDGADVIEGFVVGEDRIELIGYGTDFNSVIANAITYNSWYGVIDLGGGNSLRINNIADNSLSASDFDLS